MDIDSLLNIEKRTGIKDRDIDGFLEKASAVEAAIKGMVDGTVDPSSIKIKGIKSEDEIAEDARLAAEEKRIANEKREKLRIQRKKEEKERWWDGARLFSETGGVGNEDDDEEGEDGIKKLSGGETSDSGSSSLVKKKMAYHKLDYSRWDKWVPEDPATVEEKRERDEKEEKIRNAEFEKNNATFCEEFVTDMKEREKAKAKKEDNANVMRIKGNNEFKRKDYSTALVHYMDALKVLPYEVKTLTNIGQAYIKMGMLEDAEEFLTRVLFLDASHVKALSRFAHILSETKRYDDALIKINEAVSLDPSNSDLIKQQRELFAITEQSKLELRVAGLAQKAEESMKTKVAQINELSPAARFTPTLASTATSTAETARTQTAPAAAGGAAAGAAGSQEGFDPMDMQKMAALLETLGKGKTEGASEGSDFYTFQLLLKSLVGGRFVAEMPIPPSGADPAGMPPQPPVPEGEGLPNIFDAFYEIISNNPELRIYFRTSGALKLTSICLRNMLLKLLPSSFNGVIKPSVWSEAASGVKLGMGNELLVAADDASVLDSDSDPCDSKAKIQLIGACFSLLATACKGNRAIKLSLLEDGIISVTKEVVNLTAAGELASKGSAHLIDRDTTSVVNALLGALAVIEECSESPDEAPKAAAAVFKDAGLLANVGRLLGETSALMSSKTEARSSEVENALVQVGDSLATIGGAIIGSPDGAKHCSNTAGSHSGGMVVCGLGALLATTKVGTYDGLIGATLTALSECSRVAELCLFFALTLPDSEGSTAEAVMSTLKEINKAKPPKNKISLYRTLSESALGVLVNAARDKDIGPESVKGRLATANAVSYILPATTTCLSLAVRRLNTAAALPVSLNNGRLTLEELNLNIGRLYAALLARLAAIPSIKAALALPAPYGILCKIMKSCEGLLLALSPLSSEDQATATESCELMMSQVVTVLAHMSSIGEDTMTVAVKEGLMESLLAIFPTPRMELGSVTPASVTKTPSRIASALALGNAAMCLRNFADDKITGPEIFGNPKLLGVEKMICAMATCTNLSVRKNIAMLLAKGSRWPGIKEKVVEFRGMEIMRELQAQGAL